MTMEHGEDCCVKVAVHARPLIGDEKLQGCKDCVAVVPGKPQVSILRLLCFFAGEWAGHESSDVSEPVSPALLRVPCLHLGYTYMCMT